jgi:hypothetical protein
MTARSKFTVELDLAVTDPQSPSVLKVQQVINGETQEYNVQEDVRNAI